jgi:hypothetical protein
MAMTHTCPDCNIATGEAKRHKHIWMYRSFCDTCNCVNFDACLNQEKDNVVHSLVLKDFNHMLFKMCEEGKFDQQTSLEIYRRMRELANARGYLQIPDDKEN